MVASVGAAVALEGGSLYRCSVFMDANFGTTQGGALGAIVMHMTAIALTLVGTRHGGTWLHEVRRSAARFGAILVMAVAGYYFFTRAGKIAQFTPLLWTGQGSPLLLLLAPDAFRRLRAALFVLRTHRAHGVYVPECLVARKEGIWLREWEPGSTLVIEGQISLEAALQMLMFAGVPVAALGWTVHSREAWLLVLTILLFAGGYLQIRRVWKIHVSTSVHRLRISNGTIKLHRKGKRIELKLTDLRSLFARVSTASHVSRKHGTAYTYWIMIHADVRPDVPLKSFPQADHQLIAGEWKIPRDFDQDGAELAVDFLNGALRQFPIGRTPDAPAE